MTAAMAFFSIALSLNIAGVRLSSLRAADLKPSSVKKSFWAANSRVVRYYDNLRVVYELESRMHEMQRESDAEGTTQRGVMSAPEHNDAPQRQAPSLDRKGTSLPRNDGSNVDMLPGELPSIQPPSRAYLNVWHAPLTALEPMQRAPHRSFARRRPGPLASDLLASRVPRAGLRWHPSGMNA